MRNIIIAAIVALALIIGFWIVAGAYKYKFKSTENITVTGSAEKDFVSDLIVWNGRFSQKSMDLKTAYSLLKDDENKIRTYLKQKNVADSEIVFSAVDISKEFDTRYDENGRTTSSIFTGYNLNQRVTIESKDVEKIEKLSREITELIQSGIELNSSEPSYYYSKLSELKIDLLAKAAADAKLRAETIAKNSGSKLGSVRKASMGVFQIAGQNMNEEFSYGGVFNTSSKNKTASITLRTEYEAR